MQHAARVRESDGLGDAEEQPQALRQRHRLRQAAVEPVALHPLHRVERPPVGKRAGVVHRHDPGML